MHSISQALTTKLEQFSRLMVDSNDFAAISDFFHQELVPVEEFIAASVTRKNRRLSTLIRMLFRAISGNSAIRFSHLSVIEARSFWHGTVAPGVGGIALVHYCEDVNKGLLCYTRGLGDPNVQFIRFAVPEDLTGTEDPELAALTQMSRRPAGGYMLS